MGNSDLKGLGDNELGDSRILNAPVEMALCTYGVASKSQWLLGPDGWPMPVCEIDLRVGGKYRYVWKKEKTVMKWVWAANSRSNKAEKVCRDREIRSTVVSGWCSLDNDIC
jgi:hypothetical protein